MKATRQKVSWANNLLVGLRIKTSRPDDLPRPAISTSEQFKIDDTAEDLSSSGPCVIFLSQRTHHPSAEITGKEVQQYGLQFHIGSVHFYHGKLERASPVSARDDPLAISL